MQRAQGDIGGLGRIHTWQSSAHTDAFEGECGKVREIMHHKGVYNDLLNIR